MATATWGRRHWVLNLAACLLWAVTADGFSGFTTMPSLSPSISASLSRNLRLRHSAQSQFAVSKACKSRMELRSQGRRGLLGCMAIAEGNEQCLVPPDLDQAIEECGTAVVESILSGRRGMLINVLVPELDPSSRGYNPETMRSFCSQLVSKVSSMSLGNLRVYVQGLEETMASVQYLRESNVTSGLVEEERLKVESLLNGELPDDEDSTVLLVAPANTKEEKVTREVRRILSHAESKVVLVVNHRLDAVGPDGSPLGTLPLEFERLEPAFYVEALALQAQAANGRSLGEDEVPPNPKRIAITRKYPGLWGIYAFEDEDQRYTLLRSQKVKPTPSSIMEVCKHLVQG